MFIKHSAFYFSLMEALSVVSEALLALIHIGKSFAQYGLRVPAFTRLMAPGKRSGSTIKSIGLVSGLPIETSKIRAALLRPSCGVDVLVAPDSVYARRAIRRLQAHKLIGGALDLTIDPSYKIENFNFQKLVAHQLGCPDRQDSISAMMNTVNSKPVVLLVDEYENISSFLSMSQSDLCVVGLAEESQLTKKFVVLLIMKNKDTAERILKLNGGQKIYAV